MSSYTILSISVDNPRLKPYWSMIHSDFLKSLRFGNDWFKQIESDAYFSTYKRVIQHLLTKKDCIARLAVVTDEPDTCLGWALIEGETLHYVYVKVDQREKGIARSLVPEGIKKVTHLTGIGGFLRYHKLPDAIFNPFE